MIQNSQDFQSEIPKIFNCEAVFFYYSSIITSSPLRKVPRFTWYITPLRTETGFLSVARLFFLPFCSDLHICSLNW